MNVNFQRSHKSDEALFRLTRNPVGVNSFISSAQSTHLVSSVFQKNIRIHVFTWVKMLKCSIARSFIASTVCFDFRASTLSILSMIVTAQERLF